MILKTSLAVTSILASGLLAIPVLIGGDSGTASSCGDHAAVLETIRTIESGGNYSAPKNAGGASGAYQYIDSTWNDYGGYQSAYEAPPDVQDARADADVQQILATYHDVAYVPVVWYWPAAANDSAQMDIVPMPSAGNRLTVRQYQQHWLAVYQAIAAAAGGRSTGCAGTATGTATVDGYALPIDRTIIAANPKMLGEPHHDYPAIDLLVPVGTPVYAVRSGTVARTVDWPYNCYEVGRCDETCGVGMTISGDDGARWIYCHGSQLNDIKIGDTITTGQLIMWTGNTGKSGAPHLHLEIRINGTQRCPQTFLQSLYNTGMAIPPESLPDDGCSF